MTPLHIRFAAHALYLLATLVGRLPWRLQHGLARTMSWLWRRLDARESRVAWRNLEIAYPELDDPARHALHRDILYWSARQFFETLRIWTQPNARSLDRLRAEHGVELFDAAVAEGRGVIIAAPHFGNWELLSLWLANRIPTAVLYQPQKTAVGEAFLNLARADDVGQVTQVRAVGGAIRQLLRQLQAGHAVGILPDQQPRTGDGEFAPFFGTPALTMTLLGRLGARTGATVLFAWCERIGDGGAPAYALYIQPAPEGIASEDPQRATAVLNTEVERIARRDPAQYQWTYKRYTARPDGSGEPNPYVDGAA